MGFYRFFHSTALCRNIKKSVLGDLRKKTGYSLSHCRKALELNDNDLVKAEEWLKEQAKALGWSAAMKVQNRKAAQGLIGLAVNQKKVAMVEVNCETDFVSKNEKFRSLVESVTSACLALPVLTKGENTNKVTLTGDDLGKLEYNGKLLSDEMAILIGSIGENMVLKRAICYETNKEDLNVVAAVHPPVDNSNILLGKFGVFVTFQQSSENPPDNSLTYDICRHIIGLNPKKIGDFNEDTQPNCETELIHQDFLLDDSVTVGTLLKENEIEVVDFTRYECGETEKEEQLQQEANVVESKI